MRMFCAETGHRDSCGKSTGDPERTKKSQNSGYVHRSGCILLSLLAFTEEAQGVGADVSPMALQVAKKNADSLGVADRADFVESDLF